MTTPESCKYWPQNPAFLEHGTLVWHTAPCLGHMW
jgi:hypothetical protein